MNKENSEGLVMCDHAKGCYNKVCYYRTPKQDYYNKFYCSFGDAFVTVSRKDPFVVFCIKVKSGIKL